MTEFFYLSPYIVRLELKSYKIPYFKIFGFIVCWKIDKQIVELDRNGKKGKTDEDG